MPRGIESSEMMDAPVAPPAVGRASLEQIEARLQLLQARADADVRSVPAARVLLAGSCMGHNVDRLARTCRVPRELVSRFARRLIDNGVWQGGNTVARWSMAELDAESFWRDVAVAEGRLCRRINEQGEMEWAPQGQWWKKFEYVMPRDRAEPMAVRYHEGVELSPAEPLVVVDGEEANAVEGEEALAARTVQPVPEESWSSTEWLGSGEADPGTEPQKLPASGPGLTDEFPEAVWLG